MSIEIGFFLALLIIAVPAGFAVGCWLRNASRKLTRLLDMAPMPGEDGCPCPYCTSQREGDPDE